MQNLTGIACMTRVVGARTQSAALAGGKGAGPFGVAAATGSLDVERGSLDDPIAGLIVARVARLVL